MTKFLYLVLGTLDHDHVRYQEGAAVALTEAEAEPLIAIGVVHSERGPEAEHEELEDSETTGDPAATGRKSGKGKTPKAPAGEGAEAQGAN